MANEDEDTLAGPEGAGGHPAQARGAVSTGEGPVPGAGDEAGRGAAGGQHAPGDEGSSGRTGDNGAAAGSEAGLAADGAAAESMAADDATPAGDGPNGGDLDPRLPPGLANRPAGFAGGYLRRDTPDYAGGEPASAESGGSAWMPNETGQPGEQGSPYVPYGEYDPYPAPGQEQDYGGYGYGADQGYGQAQGYSPEAYGQAYPPPQYGDAGGYGAPETYAPDQRYGDDAGYGPGPVYGQDQPYGEGQAYGQPGYGQAPYGAQPYSGGTSYGQGAGYDQGQAFDQAYGAGQGYGQPPGQGAAPGQDAGPGQGGQAPGGERPQAGSQGQPDGQDRGAAAGQANGPGAHAAAGAQGSPASRTQAPGGEPGPGSAAPYPPPDSYRWPPPYGAPAPSAAPQAGRSPYDPEGRYAGLAQPGASGGAHSAARPYGGEPAYPPPGGAAPAGAVQAGAAQAGAAQAGAAQAGAAPGGGASPLPPLPGQAADQQVPETANDLTAEALLHGKRQAPGSGWRRLLYRGSGGLIHPRESAEALRRRELVARVRTPVAGGHHRVAVMSLKGGVGKTTTCVSLGAMLASLRGDRIIALDANPDRGTLSDKVRLETAATVRDLLNERDQIQRYADVRAFTSQAPSRLEVLASDRDPAVSIAFSEDDYYDAARVLEHYYSISLTDCGTGLLHSAMAGVLRMADQIVLVSSPSVDGARSASATLDWLDAHEYGDLVRNAVVVLSMIRPRSKSTVDLDRLEHHFASRCRAVARIPYDAHLEEGAEVDLEQMSAATVNAYLVLAATVGDGFAWPRRAVHQPA